jgi:hypothetical protein
VLHSGFLQLGLNSETSVVSAFDPLFFLAGVDGDKSAAIFPMSPQLGKRMARIQVVTLLARATRTTCAEEKASWLLTTGLGQ